MTAGLLLLDKPIGPTSHDLVQRTRRLAGTRRVGHAGTLDPAASGLMILGVDGATRLLTYLVGLDKTYEATIRLGTATTTDDAEGAPIGDPRPVTAGTRAAIPAAIAALTGEIDQVPSSVSAVHVDGRRAHELVRAGEAVDLPSRRVTIRRFAVVEQREDELDVVVDCSSGTYIRALARDLGAALGVGGHLTALRRTRVGPFDVADAGALEEPLPLRAPADVARALFPVLRLDAEERVALQQGKRLPTALPDAPVVAALAEDGGLIGLVEVRGGRTRVLMNLPPEAVVA
ncbi:tRNA pseudouridine(55) synthase TruB [Amnibacterium kyonggiense]|uniref:tRNA pseudouridine synthase B n=1 Tax=Amnibacterium kyonggiense TaxID=595671 RepID=A0A4V3EAE1_9MICO|nr:tRNA pseudouridine(55) synthase TruB [Amnibacterium kyonggiense]TDS75728.1 tRNA pseudouridine synthase B [Amnibacterium kyonggiense]